MLLLAGAYSAGSAYVAVALLSLCFGFTQFTEGPFWEASTYVAGPHTASATGVLNTGGNIAGFLAPVVGIMLDRFGWCRRSPAARCSRSSARCLAVRSDSRGAAR